MRTRLTIAAATTIVVVLVAGYAWVRVDRPAGVPYEAPTASDEDLADVADATILFAHQSVGLNILDGMASVYADRGMTAPQVVDVSGGGAPGSVMHVRIGENQDPLGKIEAFDALIRSGVGDQIDVAVLKLCYEDIREGDDPEAVFAAYRDTLAQLQQDYPDVAFVAATVPLNIKRGPLGTVKNWFGRGDNYGPEHNVVRERFNTMIREEYADGLLFDVAAIESTAPDGTRITGLYQGALYYALDKAYASDSGHLNGTGAATVAEGFLAVVARALQE